MIDINTKNARAFLGALILGLVVLAPLAQANDPSGGGNCSTEQTQDSTHDGDGIYCAVVAGPGSINIKGVASAGLGLCQTAQPGLPLDCAGNALTVGGAGAFGFPTKGESTGKHALTLWVKFNQAAECTELGPACGFDALLCTDRDYDGTCTNTVNDDQLVDGQSTGDNTNCGSKDPKNCGDGSDLSVSFCGLPMDHGFPNTAALADWEDGSVVAFIGAWASVAPVGDNTGVGVAVGTFNMWLTVGSTCTPSGGAVPAPNGGCLGLVDPTMAPFVFNCAGLTCQGTMELVVFAVGTPDSAATDEIEATATAGTTCSFASPLTADSDTDGGLPVRAAAVTISGTANDWSCSISNGQTTGAPSAGLAGCLMV